ncbi:hypothetical protein MHN80_08310 [Gordonia McavH-238-E]|uniref:hypothetical protein n=1 Tax=Gordonia sp. McavH-238-E TaxID=2917736 RepID=UPI001EF5A07B|nr:hypothetical protein [Gordonia sp. McavH-238-E]MCG7632314.1 hypothetical protein [Gordonia sp. McavH-238-E]
MSPSLYSSRRRQVQVFLVGVALGLVVLSVGHGPVMVSLAVAALVVTCAVFVYDGRYRR